LIEEGRAHWQIAAIEGIKYDSRHDIEMHRVMFKRESDAVTFRLMFSS
jgi:hypothetical protein